MITCLRRNEDTNLRAASACRMVDRPCCTAEDTETTAKSTRFALSHPGCVKSKPLNRSNARVVFMRLSIRCCSTAYGSPTNTSSTLKHIDAWVVRTSVDSPGSHCDGSILIDALIKPASSQW